MGLGLRAAPGIMEAAAAEAEAEFAGHTEDQAKVTAGNGEMGCALFQKIQPKRGFSMDDMDDMDDHG